MVTAWLTGSRQFLLASTEQDLDVILESSFSLSQLMEFYDTPKSIRNRQHWVAGALWRTIQSVAESESEPSDLIRDENDFNRLVLFMATRLTDFGALGYGRDPNCLVTHFIQRKLKPAERA